MQTFGAHPPRAIRRRGFIQGTAAVAGASLAMPNIVAAQNKGPIKVGMPSVFSGIFALLGQSSSAGARVEFDKINAAGGINGRKLELVTRDSKGKPDEATKVVRDLVSSEGCEIILNAETSASGFAVQELVRELNVLCIHTTAEVTSLTANPKLFAPTCFRSARQGIHDAIGGGRYAADIVTKKNLFKFVTAAPDYAYGRENTASFMEYAKIFQPKIEVLDQAWPKLFQPDFTEVVTKIMNAKPQALYTAQFAGDLVALIDQGLLYGMFDKLETFSVNLGDYGVLTQVKELPAGLHSGTRYNRTVPNTPDNEAFYNDYVAKNKDHKICNWSWESAAGAAFMIEALKKTDGNTDGKKLAEVIKGMTIKSPFGTKGMLTMRASDHTLVDYVVGYGITVPKDPYIKDVYMADWGPILEHEAEWKKRNGFG